VLILDKPAGPTSHDVVQRVKKKLRAAKLGHGGTLDPFATGVLVLLVNGATKLSPFLTAQEKRYRFTVVFGIETDTQDATGTVVADLPCKPVSARQLAEACAAFCGEVEQTVPHYSAVRVNGERLYRMTRRGVPVTPPRRTVRIKELFLCELCWPAATFEVACSKGTYVRTLGLDLARSLNCGGHLSQLRRLRSGGFHLEQAVTLERLDEIVAAGKVDRVLIHPARALEAYPELRVSRSAAEKVRRGVILGANEVLGAFPDEGWPEGPYRVLDTNDDLVAMVTRDGGADGEQEGEMRFKPLRVFRGIPNNRRRPAADEGSLSS
jgi:tRNA pseudouridine55 synthase